MRNTKSAMLAASMLAMVGGLSAADQAMPAPRNGRNRDYKPTTPCQDSALAREIAEHNATVERRKAEKMAAKRARNIVVAHMRGEGK